MFFAEEKNLPRSNIFNIGIRGGACKPSTGYAFFSHQTNSTQKIQKNYVNIHKFWKEKWTKYLLIFKNNNEDGQSFISLLLI